MGARLTVPPPLRSVRVCVASGLGHGVSFSFLTCCSGKPLSVPAWVPLISSFEKGSTPHKGGPIVEPEWGQGKMG